MVSSCILPFLLLSLSCFGKGMILTPAAAQIPRFENGLRTRHSLSNWVRTFNYSDALSKSILFYEGQRSGKLPANQRLRWREDSALTDGSSANVDLVGGYYDAGDNVKFGFPMAFTGTMLSWSVLEFGRFMATDISNALSAIRWVSDYLLKATAHRDLLYVQVGDPNSDHRCWERPEDMDTPRTVFTVNTTHPGSDVAAETAAALAAASIVFRSRDRAYSSMLLSRAIQVYEFADKYRGSYSDVLKSAVCPFYCSYSGYTDELLWGAAWLHKATGNLSYLEKIELNAQDEDTVKIFSWDNKHVGAQVLLSKAFLLNKTVGFQKFKTKADDYICAFIPGNPLFSMQYTPGGLLYFESESNLQYVTAASFLMLTYAKYLKESKETVSCGGTEISAQRIRMVAKSQVDYILGKNPQVISYMVAFGGRFPQMIHHRASSLPSKAAHEKPFGCKEGFFALYSPKPNPNLLVGAVVGGPDENDRFWGLRTDYIHTEPATYINAPLLGSLAYLAHSTSL